MLFTDNLCAQLDSVKHKFNIDTTNIVGIFLYGSQNYGLSSDSSDIDSIVLVKTLEKPKYEFVEAAGKIKVYTLKYFLYRLKLGDLECYEILYTKYKILNASSAAVWNSFVQEFSSCMNYDRIRQSLRDKVLEHLNHVLWIVNNKEKARYNKKRLYWCIRVCDQLARINAGESFEDSLMYKQSAGHELLKIKTINNYLSIMDFNKIYKDLVDFSRTLPRYSGIVSIEEDLCILKFYAKILES